MFCNGRITSMVGNHQMTLPVGSVWGVSDSYWLELIMFLLTSGGLCINPAAPTMASFLTPEFLLPVQIDNQPFFLFNAIYLHYDLFLQFDVERLKKEPLTCPLPRVSMRFCVVFATVMQQRYVDNCAYLPIPFYSGMDTLGCYISCYGGVCSNFFE